MRKIRCPKCDDFVQFEESRIEVGRTLILHCESCGKDFNVKFKSKKEEAPKKSPYGSIVVVENVFCERQVIPLMEGDNFFGRRCKGTEINAPIDTNDRSMDRKHCIINVKPQDGGETIYTIRDYDSLVGTFVMNDILQKNERRIISDGEIITLGATTLILKINDED
ncbi:MAG: FHA domain-containing protein [Paludibacteraceae bacterium]|nr:FHA domain-containing protein [Paludibacteraceae bacterium]